jgi:hypothetical protein
MTFEPAMAALAGNGDSRNNYRTIFGNNELDNLSCFDRIKIEDSCALEEQPLDVYQVCRELFDSNNDNVKRFIYYRRNNIHSRFKPIWKIRWQLQRVLGE